MNEINFDFFGIKSPFTRFDNADIEKYKNIANWQYPDSIPIFTQFILETRPSIIIELGSYLGWSAITMAKICRDNNIDCKILCVDTWLGSIEHWRKDLCNSLHEYNYFENGLSGMFDNFCKNVVSHEVQDYIIPLPNTTQNMFSILKHYEVTANMIYVDASHEYDNVLEDLTMYYTLLNDNGYIFGDDVCWENVNKAAIDFTNTINKTLNYSKNKNLYYIKK